jgi:hypothetical protein
MKYLITFLFLIVIASAISQDREKLTLSDSSLTIFANQQIQLENCSFGPLYLHVFEYEKEGIVKHVNLTEESKGEVMRIESFKLLEEDGVSTWIAYLKRDNDDKIYVCELEDALKTKEVKLLK